MRCRHLQSASLHYGLATDHGIESQRRNWNITSNRNFHLVDPDKRKRNALQFGKL